MNQWVVRFLWGCYRNIGIPVVSRSLSLSLGLFRIKIYRVLDWNWMYGSFILTHLHLSMPPAESFPKGMQSGQLLQADPPAAGEGTGELWPHHEPETEGCFWRSWRYGCGKFLCACVFCLPWRPALEHTTGFPPSASGSHRAALNLHPVHTQTFVHVFITLLG